MISRQFQVFQTFVFFLRGGGAKLKIFLISNFSQIRSEGDGVNKISNFSQIQKSPKHPEGEYYGLFPFLWHFLNNYHYLWNMDFCPSLTSCDHLWQFSPVNQSVANILIYSNIQKRFAEYLIFNYDKYV